MRIFYYTLTVRTNDFDNLYEGMSDPVIKETYDLEEEIKEVVYDETGAMKELLFHKTIGEIVKGGVSFDENCNASLGAFYDKVNFITITVKDLPRVNSEGGHAWGNVVLKETVEESYDKLPDGLRDIYHNNGSDLTAVTVGNTDEIERSVGELRNISIPFLNKGSSVPSVSYVNLAEVVKTYNSIKDRIFSEDELEADELRNFPHKKFAGVLIKTLDFQREYQKLYDSSSHFLDVYGSAEGPEKEEQEKYFKMYLENSLRGTKFFDIESFRYSGESEKEKRLEELNEICQEVAKRLTLDEIEVTPYAWEGILSDVVNKAATEASILTDRARQEVVKPLVSIADSETTAGGEKGGETFKEQEEFYITDNKKRIKEIEQTLNDLMRVPPEERYGEQGLLKFSRLLELGEFTSHTLNKVKGDVEGLSEEGERASDWAKKARLEAFLKTVGKYKELEILTSDPLTGLPNKADFERKLQYYSSLSEKYGETTLMMYDMGFLKYFNKLGGRVVGNLALQKAAWVFEQATQKAQEVGVSAYAARVGGDEFAVILRGGDEDRVQVFNNLIEELRLEHGEVPPHPNSHKEYRPEILQFNVGVADMNLAREALQVITDPENDVFSEEDLKRLDPGSEKYEKEFYTKILIEVQTTIADKAIDYNKAFERYRFLTKRYLDLSEKLPLKIPIPEDEDNLLWKQFELLLSFSGKALQGKSLNDLVENTDSLKQLPGYPYNISREDMKKAFEEFMGNTSEENTDNTMFDSLVRDFQHRRELEEQGRTGPSSGHKPSNLFSNMPASK
jgi:diguanylate cyclase (GGDEF)-like protein